MASKFIRKKISCEFCSYNFVSEESLQNHLKLGCPTRNFEFTCPTCKFESRFTTNNQLKALTHVSKCIPLSNYEIKCNLCFSNCMSEDFVFHFHDDLLNYTFSKADFQFKCDNCELKFPNKEDLVLHRTRHQKNNDGLQLKSFRRYPCSICFKFGCAATEMTDHMTLEHGLKMSTNQNSSQLSFKKRQNKANDSIKDMHAIYACYICEDIFYCRTITRLHIRMCEELNGYITQPSKDNNEKYMQELKRHQPYRQSSEPIICRYCCRDVTKLNFYGHRRKCRIACAKINR